MNCENCCKHSTTCHPAPLYITHDTASQGQRSQSSWHPPLPQKQTGGGGGCSRVFKYSRNCSFSVCGCVCARVLLFDLTAMFRVCDDVLPHTHTHVLYDTCRGFHGLELSKCLCAGRSKPNKPRACFVSGILL